MTDRILIGLLLAGALFVSHGCKERVLDPRAER